VTYQVTIKPEGHRGNDAANNFVTRAGQDPPAECLPDNALCTHNPMPEVVSWKTVDPSSGTPVVPGQSLTYTLHFQNKGTADGTVDKVDDITQAVDDATVATQPASSDPALAVTGFGADNRSAITGTLAAGQTVTVAYVLKVNDPDDGDTILANFIQKPSDPPPASPDCTPSDPELPDCTSNPVGALAVTKTVDPTNFSKVHPGDTLTYTLTFHNTGKGTFAVDYTDRMAGVLDDANLVSGPDTSDSALTAGDLSGGALRITGTLAADQTVRITYKVKVKAYDKQGDHELNNFLQPTGAHGVDSCVSTDPLCTNNPVPSPAGGSGSGSGTANTGSDTRAVLLLGGLLLGAGGLLSLLGVRRRRGWTS
jgi:hypothetical protein